MQMKGEWRRRALWYENDTGHWVRRRPWGPCFLIDVIKWAQRPEEAGTGLLPPRSLLGALLGSMLSLRRAPDLASRRLSSEKKGSPWARAALDAVLIHKEEPVGEEGDQNLQRKPLWKFRVHSI